MSSYLIKLKPEASKDKYNLLKISHDKEYQGFKSDGIGKNNIRLMNDICIVRTVPERDFEILKEL